MKNKRLRTLLIGLGSGVAYAFLAMLLVQSVHKSVSLTYIFILPILLGAIPVLLSTKEELQSYKSYLLLPWAIVFTFFILAWAAEFEGMICLIIIIAPFLLLGSLGAFVFRLIKLKRQGNGTKLYLSLFLPLVVLFVESNFRAEDQIHTVSTSIEIQASKQNVWNNVKNVRNIKPNEIEPHFVHLIGIPKPLNGEIDIESIGGIRQITWEKGIRFQEKITNWNPTYGFTYNVNVDPKSVPPGTLDEHVMIGGKYFDVLQGSYRIDQKDSITCKVTLTCTYRITTNLNQYSKWWADFILDDFNQMILEVIKKRSENIASLIK
jgi:hypothetical protein